MPLRPQFLVLEDHAPLARQLVAILSAYGKPTVAGTLAEGQGLIDARGDWAAWIVDVKLPDGSGLDFLARARALRPKTPALVLTACNEPAVINRAFDLGADFVMKPVERARVARFIEQHAPLDVRLRVVVARWATEHRLSDVEADVLLRFASGETREAIATTRASSVHTVKKHISRILLKTSHASLHAAIEGVMRDVTDRVR
jgi:DNA-binding NarL/FixJ family response regulator